MRYFDLHCDTMTECFLKGKSLRCNDLHVDLERAAALDTYVQCYAAWIPDDLRGEAAFQRFCQIADRLDREVSENNAVLDRCKAAGDLSRTQSAGKHGAVLTVENGAALGGELSRISELKRRGVRMCTLTWNGENELGRGVLASGTGGLTEFGKQAVKGFEEEGILVDVSHASPELFYDVAELAKKPLVASHSNAKRICCHPRNLTDDQFAVIQRSGGLVGLNFYTGFLNEDPEQARMEDILCHAEHFLSLGGEDVLSIGGDFDGASLPVDMQKGLGDIPNLFELFLRHHYSESLLEKIFFGNASRFFQKQGLL